MKKLCKCGKESLKTHRYCNDCKNSYMREWRKTHPLHGRQRDRNNARSYLHVYVKRGKIMKKPCEICGEEKVEAHHHDYAKPLDVKWLCKPHHIALHKTALSFLIIFLCFILSPRGTMAQTATNNIVNMATIFATNSPVTINSSLTVNSRVASATNSSTIYQVGTTSGLTISVTNIGPALGSSNVIVFGSGILTNKFTIP